MIWIILAAGLGANFIIVMLLFRRLRGNLNRQLRDMRAEHNSELILRALREAPQRQQAVQAANGTGEVAPELPLGPQPVRRKRHLGLFIGGAVAAMVAVLSQGLRAAWDTRRGQVVGTAIGVATVAATTIILLAYSPWEDGGSGPPSSAPTAAPTVTSSPGHTQPPSSGSSPSPSPFPSVSSDSTTASAPAPTAAGQWQETVAQTPQSSASSSRAEASPPLPPASPPAGSGTPTKPAPTPTPEPPPAEPSPGSPSPEPPPSAPSRSSALCLALVAAGLVDITVCLGGGD
ncbi:hypothetical protein SUDANB1_00400 [Streptomyces sp. enrichment culture]